MNSCGTGSTVKLLGFPVSSTNNFRQITRNLAHGIIPYRLGARKCLRKISRAYNVNVIF